MVETRVHVSPCRDLIEVTNTVHEHGQALKNGTAWQDRLEGRVNALMLLGLSTLLSTVVTCAVLIVNLLNR